MRIRDGKRLVQDGPLADAKEQIGGYFVIEVPDLDAALERAARAPYGRLLAILAARSRDIAAAGDEISEAFVAALRTWPTHGVPDQPDAWLMTAARNQLKNGAHRQAVVDGSAIELALLHDETAPGPDELPDKRLQLLFFCAHPAIDESIRTPLMLQTVLGLDAVRIGSAFLVAPATIGQRLVRAKARIKDPGMRFEPPAAEEMPVHLGDVLNAIHAAYGISRDTAAGADAGPGELAEEALFLGRLWSRDMIIEAEGQLTAAARAGVSGRFQCEAAIQSVHAQRAITGLTNRAALSTLHALLARCQPCRVTLAAAPKAAGDRPAAEWALQTAIGLTADIAPFVRTS